MTEGDVATEYEIHFNLGSGWRSLSDAIQGSSPAASYEEAWQNLQRLGAIAAVDDYYRGAEVRVIKVTRLVLSVDTIGASS